MDLKYLKSICESYYNDHDLVKQLYENKQLFLLDIFEEIKTLLAVTRLENPSLHFEFHTNYDTRDQQKIIDILIETALHDRFPNDYKIYAEEQDYKELYNSTLINESVSGTLAASLGIVLLTGLAQVFLNSTSFNKVKWKALNSLNTVTEKIHKFMTRWSAQSRVNNAIIFNNAQKCYTKCGIKSLDDISWRISPSLNNRTKNDPNYDNIFNFETPKGRNQAYCLSNCYLQWSLDQLEPLLNAYVNCLRNSGERGFELNDLNIDLLSLPSSEICKPYLKLITDHKAAYDEVLRQICEDTEEKEKFLRMYHDVVNRVLSKTSKVNLGNSQSDGTLDKRFFSSKQFVSDYNSKHSHQNSNNFNNKR